MLGLVGEFVVEVDKGALDLGQALQLLLQGLADVVRLLQGHVARQNNVHLDEVMGAERVRPHGVDVPDSLVMVPAQVGELLKKFRWG